MAGIGFELKKLFKATGVVAILKAYGYTGVVTAGPMLLGFVFLLAITGIARWCGFSDAQSDLLVSMITYSLLASMLFSSTFSMVMTRYVADLLYESKEEDVIPSLEGILCLLLPLGAMFWLGFLAFSRLDLFKAFLVFVLFIELVAAWTEMNYMSAIKDYKGILLSYAASIIVAVGVALIGVFTVGGSVELLLLSVVIGYGMMYMLNLCLLYRFFPNSKKHHFNFLPWFDEYKELITIGLASNIGLFSHLVIAWFSPIGSRIYGLFYNASQHDISALFAFLTILITTINFVASVEVNLYPKYRRYYDLFNGTGSIVEIEQAEKEMLTVLEHELIYTARRQFYATALMISVGLAILTRLPLGFDALMEGYFRILCVGYGAYAVGNVLTLILMYFTDYEDAKKASVIFAVVTTAASIGSLFLDMKYYGFGFAFGAIVYLFYSIYTLSKYTRKLPYHILSKQPLLAEPRIGLGHKIYRMIMEKRSLL